MPLPPNRARQSRRARAGQASLATVSQSAQSVSSPIISSDEAVAENQEYYNHVHWECLDTEDESSIETSESEDDKFDTRIPEPEESAIPTEMQRNAFDLHNGSNSKRLSRPYERGLEYTDRHKRRKRQQVRDAAMDARSESQSIEAMFAKKPPAPAVIPKEP